MSSTSTATPVKHAFDARVAALKAPKRSVLHSPPVPAHSSPLASMMMQNINGNLSEKIMRNR